VKESDLINLEDNRTSMDLVCVIDVSGSMAGEKIDNVKESLKILTNFLTENDRISIVLFNDDVVTLFGLKNGTSQNKKYIIHSIDSIHAGGQTNIVKGMNVGLEILKQRKFINEQTYMFLLSDGKDNNGSYAFDKFQSLALYYESSYKLSDYIINTFGYGNDNDASTLNSIAEIKNGNYYFVQNCEMIDEFFGDALGSIMTTVGQNAVLNISTIQNKSLVKRPIIKNIYGGKEMKNVFKINKDNTQCSTFIKKMLIGISRDFLFELYIPELKGNTSQLKNVSLVNATLQIESIEGSKKIEKSSSFKIDISTMTEKIEENEDFTFHLYRLRTGEAVEVAKLHADQQNFGKAKTVIDELIKEMKKLKKNEKILLLIQELENTIKDVNPKVYNVSGNKSIQNTIKGTIKQEKIASSSLNLINTNKVQSKINETIKIIKKK